MTFTPTNQELGLPENATVKQRAQKIAELGGYKGLGPFFSAHRPKRNPAGVPEEFSD